MKPFSVRTHCDLKCFADQIFQIPFQEFSFRRKPRSKILTFWHLQNQIFEFFTLLQSSLSIFSFGIRSIIINICCVKNLLLKTLKPNNTFQQYLEHFCCFLSMHHSEASSQPSGCYDANLYHSMNVLPLHLLTMDFLWTKVYKTNLVLLTAGEG